MKKISVAVLSLISVLGHAAPGNWSIGAGAIFSPNPYLNTKVNILPIPLLAYQNQNFALYGPQVKLRKSIKPGHIIGVQGMLDPRVFDTKDTSNPQLKLLNNRNRTYFVGPFYRYQSLKADISANITADVTGNSKGVFASASYAYPIFSQDRRYFFRPSVGLEWSNQKLTNYYYGVSAQESIRSGLPLYNTSSSLLPYVGLFSGINIYKKLFWLTIVRANYQPSVIHNSPMVGSSRAMFSAFTGLTWEIGNKERRFN